VSRGQHAAEDGSFGRSAGGAMARGVILILVAVLLGVVLLNATDEPFTTASDDTGVGAEDDAEEVVEEEGDGAEDPVAETTTTTQPAARPPAEVTVLVTNGSGVSGAAAGFTERVSGAGYVTADPSNLRGGERVDASVVYFTEGFEAEAAALAATLSPVPAVAALPEPAPVDDLRGASVLLVLGPDLVPG
jgi:hypothetical protein